MTSAEKRRLRRAFDQAQCDEEDRRIAIDDCKRELAVADPNFQPGRVKMLQEQLAHFQALLVEAENRVDVLRRAIREAGLGPAEPPHPGGAAAAILERDRHARPVQWNVGGPIGERNAGWESPERPGSRSRP